MPEPLTTDDELITVDELSGKLRVHKSWVYNQTMRKDADAIPRLKMGKYLRFRLADVLAWIEAQQPN